MNKSNIHPEQWKKPASRVIINAWDKLIITKETNMSKTLTQMIKTPWHVPLSVPEWIDYSKQNSQGKDPTLTHTHDSSAIQELVHSSPQEPFWNTSGRGTSSTGRSERWTSGTPGDRNTWDTVSRRRLAMYLLLHIEIQRVSGCLSLSQTLRCWVICIWRHNLQKHPPTEGMSLRSWWSCGRLWSF